MRWFLTCFVVMGFTGCAGFAHKETLSTKVDEKDALIQLIGKEHIICYLDGKAILGSANEKAVVPGQHEVVVTERVCANPVTLRLDISAGLIYQISTDRRSVKVVNNSGTTVNELFLEQSGSGQLVSRDEYQRKKQAEQEQLKVGMEQQAALAKAELQRKRSYLPQIRKIGAQICQRGIVRVGYEPIKVVSVGYVEGITDDKVQIRISRAYFERNPTVSPGGFSPSIIWDDPMRWDLCQ